MKSFPASIRYSLLCATLVSPLSARAQKTSVETVRLQSKVVNATLPYNVILPADYRASNTRRYPVLYLLHGLGGHYSDWVTKTNVADYAANYRMIIVTPEGNDGWYTDSATVPGDKYESYFLNELIPEVQKHYRTIETRYGRAIAGLSMGGYGALKFGLKFPGIFNFAGSISGALSAPSWTEKDLKELGPIRDSVMSVFGPGGSKTRKQNDIFEIVRSLTANRAEALPFFYLDCGTEDWLFSDTPQFAALLREKKVAHEYRELPGNHSWAYWDQQVREVLRIAAAHVRVPPTAPRRSRNTRSRRVGQIPIQGLCHRITGRKTGSSDRENCYRWSAVARRARSAPLKVLRSAGAQKTEICPLLDARDRNRV